VAANACLRLDIGLPDCVAACRRHLPLLGQSPWRKAYALLSAQHQAPFPAGAAPAGFPQDCLGRYLAHPRLAEACRHLLRHGRAPDWLSATRPLDLARLLHDICTLRPALLPALLHGLPRHPAALFRLSQAMPFNWLAGAMRATAHDRDGEVVLVEQLQRCVAGEAIPGGSAAQRQVLLFELVLESWVAGDWAALAPQRLVSRLTWRLMRELDIGHDALPQAIARQHDRLPQPLRRALEPGRAVAIPQPVPRERPPLPRPAPPLSLRINNAGLAILQGYIRPLFKRLELLADDRFADPQRQRRAVHCLQFLVSGWEETPEQYLSLNKLLCGLPLHEPVEAGIELSGGEKATCLGLLESVIGHWPAIGTCSVDGLRGNWLVRDGSLSEDSDRWDLTVEKRAYDVLLARSPFSYSVIKLPWMEKAIYVTWPT
jgi:hypothetical protein